MHRSELIQLLLNKKDNPRYLEIGIKRCENLFKVSSKVKVGVDPEYHINLIKKIKKVFGFEKVELYRKYSDDFFNENPDGILNLGFNVVFIDGLHNFQQSLNDTLNSLKYISNDGFIILHDCNPISEARATPVEGSYDEIKSKVENNDIQGWDGGWNGDVWKTIVYLRSIRSDLEIFTIDSDQGLGVIRFGESQLLPYNNLEEVITFDYSFLEKDRKNLLNLISPSEALTRLV